MKQAFRQKKNVVFELHTQFVYPFQIREFVHKNVTCLSNDFIFGVKSLLTGQFFQGIKQEIGLNLENMVDEGIFHIPIHLISPSRSALVHLCLVLGKEHSLRGYMW